MKHKITAIKKVDVSVRGKPIYIGHCTCGQQYKGTYAEFRHVKCSREDKLPEKVLYDRYAYSAKKRGYKMELTLTEFYNVVKTGCVYCEKSPSTLIKGEYFNGIDRMDNKLGYTMSNSLACCGDCNRMKGTLSYDEFLEKIKAIYKNNIHFMKSKD